MVVVGSTVVFEDSETFADGTRYEMLATAVPEPERYPEGIKYRFQHGRGRSDPPPVRQLPGPSRRRPPPLHTTDGVYDDVEYTGLADQVRRFLDEVDARRTR